MARGRGARGASMERATSIPIKMELLTTTNAKKASKSWCFLSQDHFSWIFHVTLWEEPSIWESYRIIWFIHICIYISLIYCGSVMNFTDANGWLIQLSQPSRVNSQAPKSGNHIQPQPIHWRTTSHLNIHVNIYQYLETTAWPRSKLHKPLHAGFHLSHLPEVT